MDQALTARLLAHAPLTALVGNRINWGVRVQKEGLPALVLSRVSPGVEYTHDGADPTESPRLQFDVYASTADTARAVATVLRTLLETPATVGGIAFSVALLADHRGPTVEDTGGGVKVSRISQDYFVWFTPAV